LSTYAIDANDGSLQALGSPIPAAAGPSSIVTVGKPGVAAGGLTPKPEGELEVVSRKKASVSVSVSVRGNDYRAFVVPPFPPSHPNDEDLSLGTPTAR